ncbi:MFS family permease [Kitasatospora sp. GP82]|nr:MFS family permease [Kitasatospora sp. GP82]
MADETPSQHALHDQQANGTPDTDAEPAGVPRQQHPVPPADGSEPPPEDGSPSPGSSPAELSPPEHSPTEDGRAAAGPTAGDDDPAAAAGTHRNFLVRGASAAGLRTGRVVHGTGRRIRRATAAEGAGESGLAKLIELHALNSFGDMLITVALASTIFFSVPTGEARGRVALYLLITMAPFALLAPVIGPLLDRMPHGRRSAMAMAMLVRALLAWTMAGTVANGGLALYPEALGVLVASKAYGVVRSVVVPRLLPPQLSLVKANSRVTLAGLLATGLAAGLGGLLHLIGPGWPLRGALLVFVIGTLMAFHLPHKVDSAKGEQRALLHSDEEHPVLPADVVLLPEKATLRTVGPSVVLALRAMATLRALVGFLVMFLAFLLREDPVGGLAPTVSLGIVAVAAGTGNALGSVFGSWLRTRGSEATVTVMLLLATLAAGSSALWYGLPTVALVAGAAGVAASLGKLALDALIQRDVPETVRTSAFARSETLLQLSWVAGGAVGIMLPLDGAIGLSVAAGMVGMMLLWTLRALVKVGLRGPATRPRVA